MRMPLPFTPLAGDQNLEFCVFIRVEVYIWSPPVALYRIVITALPLDTATLLPAVYHSSSLLPQPGPP
jgi:hypothetical protein